MLSMPVADELIKIKWKRLNSPLPGTPGAALVAGDGEQKVLGGLGGFTLPCPSVRHRSIQTWVLRSQEGCFEPL